MSTRTTRINHVYYEKMLQYAQMCGDNNIVQMIQDIYSKVQSKVCRDDRKEFEELCGKLLPPEVKRSAETFIAELMNREKPLFEKWDPTAKLSEAEAKQVIQQMSQDLKQVKQEAFEETKRVRQQTCLTCKAKNYSYLAETEELKHLLLRCKHCKTAMYCSTDCQSKDWPYHKTVCQIKRP